MGREAEESLFDVTLAQYACVVAALADDFGLDASLAAYGVAPAQWPSAKAAWLKKISAAGRGTALFTAYEEEHARAEDALGRKVTPLDEDLASFLVFIDLCQRSADLPAFLAQHKLRASDLSRVGRGWKRRFAADASYEQKIAELRRGALPKELPALTLGESRLPAAAAATAITAPPVSLSQPARPIPAGWELLTLDRYAALRAELDAGEPLASAVARAGLDEAAYGRADQHYRAAFARDPALERDFRALRSHAERTVRQRPHAPPGQSPVDFGGTLGSARPSDATGLAEPPTSLPGPASVALPPPSRGQSPGTASAPVVRRPPPVTEELRIPVRHTPAPIPFVPDPAKPPPAPIPVEPASRRPKVAMPGAPSKALQGTLDGGIPTLKALPFDKQSVDGQPVSVRQPVDSAKAPSRATPLAYPALPGPRTIPSRRPGAAARALLTLEQHAAMHAELKAGHGAVEVNARWSLSAEDRAEVDEHYRLAVQREPRVWAAWDAAFNALAALVPARPDSAKK